jgi:hypothetical protein
VCPTAAIRQFIASECIDFDYESRECIDFDYESRECIDSDCESRQAG